MNIDRFLRNVVFYPCSLIDFTPIKHLGEKGFSDYFYADYNTTREEFEDGIRVNGFHGYDCTNIEDIAVESVFGDNWENLHLIHRRTIARLDFAWTDPFLVVARFDRHPEFLEKHGPSYFRLMFAKCEAITTFVSVFSRRRISPRCLAYINPGIGYGGNFHEFPALFGYTLRRNEGGLPKYILYDENGGKQGMVDYLSIIEEYVPLYEMDNLIFAELNNPKGGNMAIKEGNMNIKELVAQLLANSSYREIVSHQVSDFLDQVRFHTYTGQSLPEVRSEVAKIFGQLEDLCNDTENLFEEIWEQSE